MKDGMNGMAGQKRDLSVTGYSRGSKAQNRRFAPLDLELVFAAKKKIQSKHEEQLVNGNSV